MTAAHTSGPWFVEADGAGVYVLSADLMVACPSPVDKHPTDSDEYIDGPETEANARLIAAAPCLLDALRFYASEAFDGYGNPLGAKARAAILKATGEGA